MVHTLRRGGSGRIQDGFAVIVTHILCGAHPYLPFKSLVHNRKIKRTAIVLRDAPSGLLPDHALVLKGSLTGHHRSVVPVSTSSSDNKFIQGRFL
jgi:hypothetical protein